MKSTLPENVENLYYKPFDRSTFVLAFTAEWLEATRANTVS